MRLTTAKKFMPKALYEKAEQKYKKEQIEAVENIIKEIGDQHSDNIPDFPKLIDSLAPLCVKDLPDIYDSYLSKGVDYFWLGLPNNKNMIMSGLSVDTEYYYLSHCVNVPLAKRDKKLFHIFKHGYGVADHSAAWLYRSYEYSWYHDVLGFLGSCPAELLTSIELRIVGNRRIDDRMTGNDRVDDKYEARKDGKKNSEVYPWREMTFLKMHGIIRAVLSMIDTVGMTLWLCRYYNIPDEQTVFSTESMCCYFITLPRMLSLLKQVMDLPEFEELVKNCENGIFPISQTKLFYEDYKKVKEWLDQGNPYDLDSYPVNNLISYVKDGKPIPSSFLK